MFQDIFSNPEIVRNARHRLRPKTVIMTIVITTVFLIFVAFLALGPHNRVDYKSWHALFIAYAWISTLAGFFYGISLTTTSIIGEKDKKTYDFMFMTPMTDWQIAIGKLLGSTLHLWVILAIMMPLLGLSGFAGQVETVRMFIFYLVLILGSLFCAAAGLLVSVSITRMTSSFAGVIIVLLIAYAGGMFAEAGRYVPYLNFYGLLSPISTIRDITDQFETSSYSFKNSISFFGAEFNGGWFTIFLYVWLTFWIMRAVIRKIRNLQGVYLTKVEAFIFFIVMETLLVGFQWEYLRSGEGKFWPSLATYLITNGMLITLLSCGLTLSREGYFSYVRQRLAGAPLKPGDKRTPPHVLHIALCLIVALGFVAAQAKATFPAPDITIALLEIFVLVAGISIFYILLQYLKTIFVTAGPLVAFIITGAVLAIPPIFIAAFDLPGKYHTYFNPLAYITNVPYLRVDFTNTDLWVHPVILGVVLIGMIIMFVLRHSAIKRIIRHRMEL